MYMCASWGASGRGGGSSSTVVRGVEIRPLFSQTCTARIQKFPDGSGSPQMFLDVSKCVQKFLEVSRCF
eukprot:jgi/Chrzof1/4804/UNPLg00808.t1